MTFSFSTVETTNPPINAGATLSGCPSISVAIAKISSRKNGLPNNAFPASSPVNVAAADEPSPDDNGIWLTQSAWKVGSERPAHSASLCAARTMRLFLPEQVSLRPRL